MTHCGLIRGCHTGIRCCRNAECLLGAASPSPLSGRERGSAPAMAREGEGGRERESEREVGGRGVIGVWSVCVILRGVECGSEL